MDAIAPMAAVLMVLGLLAAALWWLRSRQLPWLAFRSPAPRNLELLERLALTPHHSLHLVRVGDRRLLVAAAPSGCTVLEKVS